MKTFAIKTASKALGFGHFIAQATANELITLEGNLATSKSNTPERNVELFNETVEFRMQRTNDRIDAIKKYISKSTTQPEGDISIEIATV